jgi:hypothetical protein
MNYFSRMPILLFAIAWVAITGTWLVVGLSIGGSSTSNTIAAILLTAGVIFVWSRYNHLGRISTVFHTGVPEEMYMRLKKTKQGEYEIWYAQLRLESSPYDKVDIVFSIPETDWLPQISRNEKVKVYRGKKKDEIVIETKFGLLSPTNPVGVGPTSIWH